MRDKIRKRYLPVCNGGIEISHRIYRRLNIPYTVIPIEDMLIPHIYVKLKETRISPENEVK